MVLLRMRRALLLIPALLLAGACGSESTPSSAADENASDSSVSVTDPRVDATVKRIFEKIQSDDGEFALELGLSAVLQQVDIGDSIGAASEQIYGRYGPKASDESLNAWLDNLLDDFRRVRDQYPKLCNGYINGSPFALAELYDNLFTVEDKLEEVQIIEAMVQSAIDDPKEIGDFNTTQGVFDGVVSSAEEWAETNDVLDES